ncbi:MAG: hypothetical protein KDD82_11900, partial [Planctomycetes bacterium]|nr:hypothetical protein [Planctomycetota bacterium]
MTSRLLMGLALLSACLLPAGAQDAPPGPGSLELRLAERYGVSAWPASAGPRLGLDPATVRSPGWVQLEVTRDARRAEARVALGP